MRENPSPGELLHPGFHPLVVNVRVERFDVYVGRDASFGDPLWGNRFRVGRDGTLLECVALHQREILRTPYLMSRVHLLRGKRLGCHCKGKWEFCHANTLAYLANRELVEQPLRRTRPSPVQG